MVTGVQTCALPIFPLSLFKQTDGLMDILLGQFPVSHVKNRVQISNLPSPLMSSIRNQMVLARLVEPASKERVPVVLGELGIDAVTARSLFRSLARCTSNDYRSRVQGACLSM